MNWWHRNRWGLILILPALALLGLTNSQRIVSTYLPSNYTVEHPPQGFDKTEPDPLNPGQSIRYRLDSIKLTGLEHYDSSEEAKIPAGARVWLVSAMLEAPVDVSISACMLRVFDQHGREYDSTPALLGINAPGSRPHCEQSPPKGSPTDWKRTDTTWRKTWLFLLPDDAEPQWLRVAWSPPDYIRLPLK